MNGAQWVACLLGTLCLLYVVYAVGCRCAPSRPRPPPPGRWPGDDDAAAWDDDAEWFEGDGAAAAGDAAGAPAYDLQAALDFSDLTLSDREREEFRQVRESARQIQTVDERFAAAKRRSEEHGMRPEVMPLAQRRRVVESLVRRPYCGRRTRSWRTEFSDSLRGDVVPRNVTSTLGIMRVGRSDPMKDLHPGALGQMSGLAGQWVSDENIPDNAFDEFAEDGL